jgi:hypothetical protein
MSVTRETNAVRDPSERREPESKNETREDVIVKFPRFMMCKFAMPAKPLLDSYSGYQHEESGHDESGHDESGHAKVHYFEIEILKVQKNGCKIIFRSNDPDTSLDRYKDTLGDICMNWNKETLQYISRGVSYTLPWSTSILTDNIILLPSHRVGVKSVIKNLFSGKIPRVERI